MKTFLLWISLSMSAAMCFGQPFVGGKEYSSDSLLLYNAYLTFRENGISGICALRVGSNGISGTLVNEFGIKAMDFMFKKGDKRVRISNVIPFLNKWYIRKIIVSDLTSFFLARDDVKDRRRNISVAKNGDLFLENKRYRISYHFIPIKQNDSTQ